jgi:hypothetical protein
MTFEQPSGLDLLEETRELVGRAWCQGADARDQHGDAVNPWEASAASWSLLGAIVAVLERQARTDGEMPLDDLATALYMLAGLIDTDSLAAWNDDRTRSQGDVLDVLDAAAANYRRQLTPLYICAN